LESVPRSSSFDEQAHLLRALAYQKTGDPGSSLQAFRAGLEIHPHHPGLWLGIGDAQRALGRYEEADESYHKALSYDPQNGDALNNLGLMYASKGDMEGAIKFLERALSDLGRPLEVFSNLSAAYRRSGMLNQALEVAKTGEAIRSGPDILNAIGNAYSGLGDQKNAMDAFKAGLLEDPDHVQLHFNLARSYESLDRVENAIRQYKEVLKRLGDRFSSRKTSIENRIRLLETGADSTQ
jgi:tetratricopeptide (TPR) repeat protein